MAALERGHEPRHGLTLMTECPELDGGAVVARGARDGERRQHDDRLNTVRSGRA
jgi:hypothetical protein